MIFMMDTDQSNLMDSPMDVAYSLSALKVHGRSDSGGKRKYDDDSGYFTTPGSSIHSKSITTPNDSFNCRSTGELTPSAAMSSSFAPIPFKVRRSCDGYSPFEGALSFEAMECSFSEDLGSLSPEIMKRIPDGLSPILRAASLTPKKNKPTASTCLPYRSRDLPKPRRKLTLPYDRYLRLPRETLCNQETVDFVYYFGMEYDFRIILNKVFKYLGDEDICKMTMVSKVWRIVCMDMPEIKLRWRNYVSLRRQIKENLPYLHSKGHLRSPLRTSNMNRSAPPGSPTTPVPDSPSKFRFSLFRKAAQTLKAEEQLVDCPVCSRPSRCTPGQNRGVCTSLRCMHEFCTTCRSPYHDPAPCRAVPTPGDTTPQKSRPIVILSNKSRRNLRRLLSP